MADNSSALLWERKRANLFKQMNSRISKLDLAFIVVVYLTITRGILKLPFRGIAKLSFTSLFIAACASLKAAPPPQKSVPELYPRVPILGNVEWLKHAILECPVQQQIEEARKANYKAFGLCLLGGTRDLTIYDRADIEHVLKDNWRNFTKNVDGHLGFLDYFGEVLGRGIFAVDWDDGEWQAHRKTASYMFSNAALTSKMESSFNKHAESLVKSLEKKADTAAQFNFQEAMQALTFDSICDIAFGVDPGALEASLSHNERIDFLVRFDRLQQNLTNRFMMPGPIWQFLRKMRWSFEGTVESDAKELRAYVQRIIDARKVDPNAATRGDLLSLYIDTANKSADKTHLKNDDYLSDMILNFAIAGRDTTSCTLTNLFLELALDAQVARREGRKSVADRMREEMESVIGKSRGVSMDDIKDLRYSCAVFNEVLRLHPPVAINGRICRENDVLPSGVEVVHGTFVWISNVAIGRDPNRWTRPNDFYPERWLEALQSGDPVKRVDEYLHPVFWGGPRLCIGKDAARLEVLCMAKRFLEEYDFILGPNFDNRTAKSPVQFYEKGLWGTVVRRHSFASVVQS